MAIKKLMAIVGTAVVIAGSVPLSVPACAPMLEYAVFVYQTNPDLPLKHFASGDLGILQRGYARSYLVVAYRYLENKKLSADEEKAVLGLWKKRINASYSDSSQGAVDDWLKTRKLVAGAPKLDSINTNRPVTQKGTDPQWSTYLNCTDDAFASASKTLKQRIASFGATNALVKDWLKGQDAVFCHCSGPEYNWDKKNFAKEGPFPDAYTGSDSSMKADRAYQIAAAHFYAQMFDESAKEFLAIAADSTSPYHLIAPYLAARSMLRKCTLADKLDTSALEKIRETLEQIMANPKLASVHSSAQALVSYIDCMAQPQQRLRQLAKELSEPGQAKDFQLALGDYTKLLDNYFDDNKHIDNGDERPYATGFDKMPAGSLDDDLTDWICTFSNAGEASKQNALKKWSQKGTLPWLVAAATVAEPKDASEKLLDALKNVPASSPAYLSLSYQYIRLLLGANKREAAEARLNEVLKNTAAIPPSSLNMFLDQRLQVVHTFDEFLKALISKPSVTTSDPQQLPESYDMIEGKGAGYYKTDPLFRDDATAFFNRYVPVSLFSAAAKSAVIPGDLKQDMLQAAWLRAFMVAGALAVKDLTAPLSAAVPALAPYLKAFDSAKSESERAFAAAYMVLKFPGMRPYVTAGVQRVTPFEKIDDYQDNWWCVGGTVDSTNQDDTQKKKDYLHLWGRFLSAADTASAAADYKKLNSFGPAPNYLCNSVIAFAKSNPRDPRVPEALSLAVARATHYGCTDGNTPKLSAEAFRILHTAYKGNPWTKKTPYHY
jgi:hypothetical protein